MTITEKLHLMKEIEQRNNERVKEWKERMARTMIKWYATITNIESGNQLTVGEYSKKALQKTLRDIQKRKIENLDKCQVDVYTVQI